MSKLDIIRAWKNPEYRQSLSQAEQAQLPAHPAGAMELSEADLDQVSAGAIHQSNKKTVCGSPCDTFSTDCNSLTFGCSI